MNNNSVFLQWSTALRSFLIIISAIFSTALHAQTITYGANQVGNSLSFYVQNSDWADVHYELNGGSLVPLRMTPSNGNNTYVLSPLYSGNSVRYRFVYWDKLCICQKVSDWATATIGSSGSSSSSAPAFSSGVNQNGTSLVFFANGANWADIRYKVNGGSLIPVRMTPQSGNNSFTLNGLTNGDSVEYSFVYWDSRCSCQKETGWVIYKLGSSSTSSSSVSSSSVGSSSYDGSEFGTTSKGTPNNLPGTELPCIADPLNTGYCLVWNDEFNTSQLDKTKWSLENNCYGGGNGEAQCYVRNRENTFVSGGNLHIKAVRQCTQGPLKHDDDPNYNPNDTLGGGMYTSARLRSWYKGDFKYGRFEMRAKLPEGQGTWPAFWLLPSDWKYGGWAASGEIDIMEAVNLNVGGENRVYGTLHYGDDWPRNVYTGSNTTPLGGVSPASDFHTYAIEWEEGEIRWYLDGNHYATQRSTGWYTNTDLSNPFAPFDQRFHILLNLAIGGSWAGNTNNHGVDASVFPQEMQVDYVRVYQCNKDRIHGKGCGTIGPNPEINPGSPKPKPLDYSKDIPVFDGSDIAPFSYGFWAWPGAVHGRPRVDADPVRGGIFNLEFDADNGVAYWGVNRKVDLTSYRTLDFDLKVSADTRATKSNVQFRADCFDPCRSKLVDVGYPTDWKHFSIPLTDLSATGLDLKSVNSPFVFTTQTGNQKGLQIQVDNMVIKK